MSTLSYCDLFCGCGGFSLGFKQEGFKHLGGIDMDAAACRTYAGNISQHVLNLDITETHSREFQALAGERPDIVIASPPCEGFSVANQKREQDPYVRLYDQEGRGHLTILAIDWICDLDPKIGFIIENVPVLAQHPTRDFIQDELERIGYKDVYFNMIYADRLGAPARRPRVFISNIKFSTWPDEEFAENEEEDGDAANVDGEVLGKYKRTVWDAIGDLPDPTSIHDIPDHDFVSVQGRKENEISALRWKDSLVQFDSADGRSKNSWIRLHPWKLSPIVMGKSVFIHPFEDRQITVREMARLQGFPDDFAFSGTIYEKRNQVGEAVSPIVSRYLARIIKERQARDV